MDDKNKFVFYVSNNAPGNLLVNAFYLAKLALAAQLQVPSTEIENKPLRIEVSVADA